MKTNPFFTAFKPIKVGDKVTIKPEFMEPRGAANTTYATLDEVKAAVAAGAVVHYATPSYTVKQSKFDPEDFNVICVNGHCAYLGKDYKPEDFYSIN